MFQPRRIIASLLVTATAAAAVGLPALSASAASLGVADGGVVANAVPATFTPNIVDGAVESMVQVGSLMVVGGSFTQVTPTAGAGAGTTVTRNYLLRVQRHHRRAGHVVRARRSTVRSTRSCPTADGTGVYVGGMFTTAGGVSTRLAEFNLSDRRARRHLQPVAERADQRAGAGGQPAVRRRHLHSVKSVEHDGLASRQSHERRDRPVPDGQPHRQPQLRPGRRRGAAPGSARPTSRSRPTAPG